MPYCAVLSCRNKSTVENMSSAGISYHRFPKDPGIKEKWINATGRDHWFPQTYNTICSEHFLETDLYMSPNGKLRYIKATAIPTQKIVLSIALPKSVLSEPSLKRQVTDIVNEGLVVKRARTDDISVSAGEMSEFAMKHRPTDIPNYGLAVERTRTDDISVSAREISEFAVKHQPTDIPNYGLAVERACAGDISVSAREMSEFAMKHRPTDIPNYGLAVERTRTDDISVSAREISEFAVKHQPTDIPNYGLAVERACAGDISVSAREMSEFALKHQPTDIPNYGLAVERARTEYIEPPATLLPIECHQHTTPTSSTNSTPRKKKLKNELIKTQEKLKSREKKIKRLQAQNRRLKKKIRTLEDILIPLQDKYSLTNENVTCLQNTNVEVKDLLMRHACNTQAGVVSTAQYSPALRSFALTLHFYSPRAYEYVRNTFSASLPHPRTLKKWYSHIGGEPGFTQESFAALKMKADSTDKPILATLVIDEMSIRRRVEWDGQKLHGYVDMGTGLEGDHLGEAKEALVFLVTAINANFKVPVGYFLVDGVTGLQRAELVKQCLEMTHEAGIKIVALTFDGCAANVSMAANLGCCFQNNDIKFEHPVTKDIIVAVLDPCHMVKLLRNTFECFKTLIDEDGNKIQWQHVAELNDLQYKEGFHLSNKLRDRHLNFKNEKMKVKLATQLLSQSVADALKYCRTELNLKSFENSQPTEKFILMCNNIFDVFNSRNLHFFGFKKALNEKNAPEIFEFLRQAANYLSKLKMENGTLLVKSLRKTGFLGFLGCIEAMKHLYSTLIETKILICLPFYKLSQDHLEHLFCNIRAQGGSNNNPTARQFVSAYKKILVHVQLKDSSRGNCTALEQISILNCSSAVQRINKSTFKDVDLDDDIEEELESDIENFSDFSKHAIAHIAGYIVRSLSKKIECGICVQALSATEKLWDHGFTAFKSRGGLTLPAQDVILICRIAENILKRENYDFFFKEATKLRKEVLYNKILNHLVGMKVFDEINYHQIGLFPASNHVTDLIKAVIEKYVNIRVHHLLKLKIKLSKRQLLNKYVLFQGQ